VSPARPLDVLGAFAAALEWPAVPAPVQERARLTLRDTIGTMLGGAATPAGRIASRVAAANPAPALAAFEAAVHASALDFDDGHYDGGAIHPGSVVIPALLVAARDLDDVDTHRFLTAQVAGYEIGLRAARLIWPRSATDDYHCTGTGAALGAAAAVARLRGGDADTIGRAIAIAWAHAPMATFQLPMVKESIGWAAATALFAADLAAAGFMTALDDPVSAMEATFTPTPFHRAGAMDDPFIASLGTVWEAGRTYFKPYAACRYTHTAIRSLQELVSEHGLRASDVAAIDVHTHLGASQLRDQVPASLDHAQYSFPFVLAAVLDTGAAGATEICADALRDPARLAAAAKVRVHHDPELDPHYPAHYPTRIAVRTTGGDVHERTRLIAPGDADDPLSAAELRAKFVRLARLAVGCDEAERAADALVDPGSRPVRPLLAGVLATAASGGRT
jgi:2-methylcitrate dehydratase PrpD